MWDLDVRDGLVAVVASRDPLPAGYYEPSVVVARLGDGGLSGVRELHRGTTSGQLARPRLAADLSTVYVLRGLSIVSGEVLRLDVATGAATVVPRLDEQGYTQEALAARRRFPRCLRMDRRSSHTARPVVG